MLAVIKGTPPNHLTPSLVGGWWGGPFSPPPPSLGGGGGVQHPAAKRATGCPPPPTPNPFQSASSNINRLRGTEGKEGGGGKLPAGFRLSSPEGWGWDAVGFQNSSAPSQLYRFRHRNFRPKIPPTKEIHPWQ